MGTPAPGNGGLRTPPRATCCTLHSPHSTAGCALGAPWTLTVPARSGYSILRLALGFFSGHSIRSRAFKNHGSLALHMMYQLVIIPCLSSPCAFRFHRFPKFVDDVGKRKRATLGEVLFALLAATSGCRHPEITRNICVSSLKLRFRTRLSTTLPLSGSSTARTRIQLYFSPERALHDNVSPCLFWLVCRPEHSTVRCAGGCRHERAHRLMASMGLSRLDDLSLWTPYSRTAGDTASSSSLISPHLLQVFLAIAFRFNMLRDDSSFEAVVRGVIAASSLAGTGITCKTIVSLGHGKGFDESRV